MKTRSAAFPVSPNPTTIADLASEPGLSRTPPHNSDLWSTSKDWTCQDLIKAGLDIPILSPWTPNRYPAGYTGWGAGDFKGSDVHITALAKRLIDAGMSEQNVVELWEQGYTNASHLQVLPFFSGKVCMPTKLCLEKVFDNGKRNSDTGFMDMALNLGGALKMQADDMSEYQMMLALEAMGGTGINQFMLTKAIKGPSPSDTTHALAQIAQTRSIALESFKRTQEEYCKLAHAPNAHPTNDGISNLCQWPNPSWVFNEGLVLARTAKEFKEALASIKRGVPPPERMSGRVPSKRKADE